MRLVVWFKRSVDPIVVLGGRELLTLRDAAEYITAVPKAEHDAADWQVAWSPRTMGRKRFREYRCCGPRTETNRSKRPLARSQEIGATPQDAPPTRGRGSSAVL